MARRRCPKCNSMDFYIVRSRCGDVVKESWYCSACFFDEKVFVEEKKNTPVIEQEAVR